jgi:hypothetical protein
MTSMLRRALLVTALALAASVGCQSCCTEEPLISGPEICPIATAQCEPGFEFRFGGCVQEGCLDDSECCPGTRCRADLNLCFPILLDQEYECDLSSDCDDAAQRCIPTTIGRRDPLNTCVYELCSGDSDCGFGRACFAGRCITKAPCGGGCPDGSACDVITGKCAGYPAGNGSDNKELSPGCNASCGPTALKVFKDPATMSGERCCALECECRPLPPIVPTRFGRYSRVAFTPARVLVSAYDGEFGDLVLAQYKADGSFARLDYLDGIPLGGAVSADPIGPRGGIADPGPNVGTHTSIAADLNLANGAGLVRIAYHDEDGRSLKVAVEQESGAFVSHFVDGGDPDGIVGRFTDMAIDASGTIYVTYMAHNTSLAGLPGKSTGLKLARSRTPTPTSAADWDIFVVDARPVFDATAAGLPPESPDLPRGRGLYTSIALDVTTAIVAYYDFVDGDLRVATVDAAGAITTAVVDGDGQNGRRNGDVGRYPTVAFVLGNLHLVYEDFGRHEVRAWRGAVSELGNGGTYTLVDRGQDPARSGKQFVGAGARLAHGADAPIVVYQDASNLDLKLARFDGTAWVPSVLVQEGAHGFYSDIAIGGGKAYIVSVEARLDTRGREASRLGMTVQAVP